MSASLETLHFHGPFTFVDRGHGIASSGFADRAGIYLWVMTDGQRRFIHYVGETTAFLKRHKEHLTQILGLNYGVFRPNAVADDDPAPIFGGMWRDKSDDPITHTVAKWLTLQRQTYRYLESLEVFFAPTQLETQTRKHVEGCLARQLRERHPAEARFYPADNRTIPRQTLGVTVPVTCDRPIEGLDSQLEL